MAADPAHDPQFVDAVARRVIELLDEPPDGVGPSRELLTVADVARRYRVRPGWVYAHRRELGVVRLGRGPKARLRFDAAVVEGVLEVESRAEARPARLRRRRRLRSSRPPRA